MPTFTDDSRSLPVSSGLTRRRFLAGAAASVAASAVLRAEDAAGPRIRLGLIGCGGRGTWIADLFKAEGGYDIVAAADYFGDRVNAFGDRFGIPAERRYTGLSGYKRLLDSGSVDAVAIISPPYFHPEQAAAAVEAGVHVYLAKPIAVDVPGCLAIRAAGEKATAKGLVFLVDFQTRAQPLYIEAVKQVHAGAIGDFTFGEAKYHAGALGLQADPGSAEARLRNWVFDIALSGDIITEQNIHSIDVISWILGTPPLAAFGTGGRKVRTQVGDCRDHFSLLFTYPGGVGVTFSSKQYDDRGSDDGIVADVFGTKGRIVTKYGGRVMIVGENSYPGGNTGQIYREGAVNNIADFRARVGAKRVDNPTVAPSVVSNLATILGRTAADTGKVVTWDELLASGVRVDGRLGGLKD